MLKRKIFAKVKDTLSQFLYGFNENALEIGIFSGTIELKNLIVRPDAVNKVLEAANTPIILKAGLISKIKIEVSSRLVSYRLD